QPRAARARRSGGTRARGPDRDGDRRGGRRERAGAPRARDDRRGPQRLGRALPSRSAVSVRDHYEVLLAEVYTWSIGDFDEAVERETARFHRAGVAPSRGGTALDLGAGSGVSAIALARLGYRVVAVDLSPTLLAELAARRGDL